MQAAAMEMKDIPLPALREDLQIVRRDIDFFGGPSWVLLDPVRNKFFTVGFELFQLLSLWNANDSASRLATSVCERYGREPSRAEIEDALMMLDESQLTTSPITGGWRALHRRATGRPWYSSAMHGYLFFKIPLARPEPFIAAAWPYVSFLLSRGMAIATLIIGILGLYLVSRQWDAFLNTLPYLFSLQGAAVSFLALALVKSIHECGHALAAHRHGCQIPTVGLAFMVLVPRLYTDVTETWRLGSRRARLSVAAAGVVAELYIAAFALFVWNFVPDGPVRSAVFVLATTSWLLSLVINLNPFIRFDGYYMLVDTLGIDNLQPRSFAHLRWRLRRLLFGLDDPAPEILPRSAARILTAYALITMVYRLILYVGIAILVYYFFIKAVGVILFAVEVFYFILLPVLSEFRIWWSARDRIVLRPRTYVTLFLSALLLAGLAVPLSTTIHAPAVLRSRAHIDLHAPEAGRLVWLQPPDRLSLREGSVLAAIVVPSLDHEIELVRKQVELAERRLAGISADRALRTETVLLEGTRQKLLSQLQGLLGRKRQLTIRMPRDVEFVDVDPQMRAGRSVSPTDRIATAYSGRAWVAHGYVAEDDAVRLADTTTGVFVPTDISRRKLAVTVSRVAVSAADRLELPQLASVHGGPIAVTSDARGNLVPGTAQHLVTAIPNESPPGQRQETPGVLLMEGEPESILEGVWRQVLRVLLREFSA
jgi:putative peptide zinc metalloprotease protein